MAYMQYKALSKSLKIEEELFNHGSLGSPFPNKCIHFAWDYLDSDIFHDFLSRFVWFISLYPTIAQMAHFSFP